MRKTLPLLALLALAAVSGAKSYADSTVTTDVTLAANPDVQQLGLVQEAYHLLSDGSDGDFAEDLGGTLDFGGSTSTGHAGDGLTTFSATASARSTLDIPDYAAVPRVFPDGGEGQVFQGCRYYLTLKNLTDVDQTVSFHVAVSWAVDGAADSPVGQAVAYPDGSYTPGAYAESDYEGGVVDKSTDDVTTLLNTRAGFDATALGDGTAVRSYQASGAFGAFDATYVLPATQIQTFEIYAGPTVNAQFVPTPEPAAFLPLGLGALGLLRRRRCA